MLFRNELNLQHCQNDYYKISHEKLVIKALPLLSTKNINKHYKKYKISYLHKKNTDNILAVTNHFQWITHVMFNCFKTISIEILPLIKNVLYHNIYICSIWKHELSKVPKKSEIIIRLQIRTIIIILENTNFRFLKKCRVFQCKVNVSFMFC